MALVTFYALTQETIKVEQNADAGDNSDLKTASVADTAKVATEIAMASELLLGFVSARKKVTVLCKSQAQAESFDDFIWQFPADKFIPHNLYGEGPDMGTPVEIIWHSAFLKMPKLRNTAVVINLSQHFMENTQNIQHIIDFVPVNDDEKMQARERYKKYKQAGFTLEYKSA